jgi:hypothetical protein
MAVAMPRPDLAAHTRAVRSSFPQVARQLRTLLGARLVAYLGSVQETRAVHQWADNDRTPSADIQRRLRVALRVAMTIAEAESAEIAQAWFQGLNPQLDDHSPARLLREGELEEVGPAVIAAARAFLVGG